MVSMLLKPLLLAALTTGMRWGSRSNPYDDPQASLPSGTAVSLSIGSPQYFP